MVVTRCRVVITETFTLFCLNLTFRSFVFASLSVNLPQFWFLIPYPMCELSEMRGRQWQTLFWLIEKGKPRLRGDAWRTPARTVLHPHGWQTCTETDLILCTSNFRPLLQQKKGINEFFAEKYIFWRVVWNEKKYSRVILFLSEKTQNSIGFYPLRPII